LKRVNGIGNHIHILVEIHPNISVAALVQQLKRDSSVWMTQSHLFPNWFGWCEGYFACAVSPKAQDAVIEYIKSQKQHHRVKQFDDEIHGIIEKCEYRF
jgi:REP element-mobilizing transposase RayT